jgi:hypothetical protein
MFKNTFQSDSCPFSITSDTKCGDLILFSCYVATLDNQHISRIKPLQIWDKEGASIFMLDLMYQFIPLSLMLLKKKLYEHCFIRYGTDLSIPMALSIYFA